MQTIATNGADFVQALPGMTVEQATELMKQADKFASGETDQPAEFIATSRTDFGELLHEARWSVTREPRKNVRDIIYTIKREISTD